ncbi:MAG: ribbon-helix-helix protein, CopG family [Deltaproteobacteria bacterium]|nr:ribbon-helix-helix protein, CopG family [Deltaproteobacteria bacterium]
MRITIHLPDKLAEEVRAFARSEGISTSRFIATGLEKYLMESRKRKHAERILNLAGKVEVSDNALELLEESRRDNRI